ncbi:MAG: thioredoxin domain-containing protein, partial [Actinomycetota bacterium]|nr:thioredoxin domain-containing protein [Actinomycetota bacterium]
GEEAATALGATPDGNWEGTNIPWRPYPDRTIDEPTRQRLFEIRERRVKPSTDDKVLASWNGLAISVFAVAGRVLGESKYVDAAVAAADFVLSALRRDDGRLVRAWREGRTSGPAYLDDHALMAAACLDLYETTFETRWFEEARSLADDMLRLFRDEEGGGFFQTGSDAERLVIRPKELFDNAVPSGNSVAANVLQRIALFTGDTEYATAGVSALRLVRDLMERAPTGFGEALGALDLYLSASKEVAIVGDPSLTETRALVDEVWKRYLPNVVLAVAPMGDAGAAKAIPLLEGRDLVEGKPAAYVCERFVCQRPVTDARTFASQLGPA